MIARLDYRRKMTAALALATIVVLWVVLAAFLITSLQAPAPPSFSVGNPAAYMAGGGSSDFTNSSSIERHAEVVAAYKSGGVVGADFTKGSSIERHAEVVAAYNAAH